MSGESTTLILGGARSGKSRHAERLALALSASPVYLATSLIYDEDHRRRVARHRRDRDARFSTVEEPLNIAGVAFQRGAVVVVDCITLWITNLLQQSAGDAELARAAAEITLERALEQPVTWLLVSNEVGQGVHAPTELGRKFADLQGLINQFIAARAANVCWLVAGIPLYVKGQAPVAG